MKCHFEKVTPAEGLSFATENVIGPVVDCVFHVHPEFELTFVESSFGVRLTGDSINEFREHDLVLAGPMLPHHYVQFPHDSAGPEWSKLKVIKFKKDFAGKELFDLNEFEDIKRMLQESSLGLAFTEKTAIKAEPLIHKVFNSSPAMRVVAFLELLVLLSESEYKTLTLNPLQEPDIPLGDARLQRVLDYIHSRLSSGKDITQSKTAKVAGITPQSFSKYFRQSTRKNFIDYVVELKLGRACSMLAGTDMTVLEICTESGFNNLSNFNRHFRKYKGMTPREYRDKYRKLGRIKI
jgi:AraC-like DNA-binding protein